MSDPDTHVYPRADIREHVTSDGVNCWCRPQRDWLDSSIIIHNSGDRREDYEGATH